MTNPVRLKPADLLSRTVSRGKALRSVCVVTPTPEAAARFRADLAKVLDAGRRGFVVVVSPGEDPAGRRFDDVLVDEAFAPVDGSPPAFWFERSIRDRIREARPSRESPDDGPAGVNGIEG